MAPKKSILVVGAGAAGMACAEGLAQHPDRFKVTLVEAQGYCGGQAFSIPIDKEKHGAEWLNQGVQGGSPIFHHTNRMIKKQGLESTPVELQVSFGKGKTFWTNLFPTPLIERHGKEIRKFTRILKIVHYLRPLFALMSIKTALKLFMFSNDFINYLILPMIALFLGTGNATPEVPMVMLEVLFDDPTVGMWYPPDSSSLISNYPPMIVFPIFRHFYSSWESDLRSRGVDIRLSTKVDRVISRNKREVKVVIITKDGKEVGETYDEIVLCCLADTSLGILGNTATWMEKRVLGSAKFSDDITVTHYDATYMEKRYQTHFDENLALEHVNGTDHRERVEKARQNFKPMYYIVNQRADGREPQKLDMSFDCNHYQSQLPKDIPLDRHVFQTIFLNKKDEHQWTRDEIDKEKIIAESWWHQLCHSWTHYAFVVPWLSFINHTNSTTYAGSWTLVNAHEVAIISGLAAACSLGADYPSDLQEDKFARTSFEYYCLLAHRKRLNRKREKGSK